MSLLLRVELSILVLVYFLIIFVAISKEKLRLKYALVWLLSGFLMFCGICVPNLIEKVSRLLGFETTSNMIFFMAILIIFGICFTLTIVVSVQSQKIKLLIQELSILKSSMEVKK